GSLIPSPCIGALCKALVCSWASTHETDGPGETVLAQYHVGPYRLFLSSRVGRQPGRRERRSWQFDSHHLGAFQRCQIILIISQEKKVRRCLSGLSARFPKSVRIGCARRDLVVAYLAFSSGGQFGWIGLVRLLFRRCARPRRVLAILADLVWLVAQKGHCNKNSQNHCRGGRKHPRGAGDHPCRYHSSRSRDFVSALQAESSKQCFLQAGRRLLCGEIRDNSAHAGEQSSFFGQSRTTPIATGRMGHGSQHRVIIHCLPASYAVAGYASRD